MAPAAEATEPDFVRLAPRAQEETVFRAPPAEDHHALRGIDRDVAHRSPSRRLKALVG
jgi:hypothetical protein